MLVQKVCCRGQACMLDMIHSHSYQTLPAAYTREQHWQAMTKGSHQHDEVYAEEISEEGSCSVSQASHEVDDDQQHQGQANVQWQICKRSSLHQHETKPELQSTIRLQRLMVIYICDAADSGMVQAELPLLWASP